MAVLGPPLSCKPTYTAYWNRKLSIPKVYSEKFHCQILEDFSDFKARGHFTSPEIPSLDVCEFISYSITVSLMPEY